MTDRDDFTGDIIPRLFALAAKLEAEGQYNNAKLVRAAAEAIALQAAYATKLPADKSRLAYEMHRAAAAVSAISASSDLASALKQGADVMDEGRLPLIDEAPHPYVCRICGHVTLTAPVENCPVCSARPLTYKRFPPIYWLDNLDPFEALAILRQTPLDVAALMEGLTENELTRVPEDGGWNLRNAIAHLRDAQGVMEFRINLMIKDDNPRLESKAVFEWAAQEEERPPETGEIYQTYYDSRQRVLVILEDLPLKDWWRTGEHEEFGSVTIMQQASYFASHELTHFPQIEKLL